MTNEKSAKIRKKFTCDTCDYMTCDKKDFSKHLKTIKHKSAEILTNTNEKSEKSAQYICECGKEYKHKPSLYNHKKKCKYIENISASDELQTITKNELADSLTDKTIIMQLFQDMKTMFMDSQKQITSLIPG